jgi:PAS domain S-box-containing protein
MARWRPITLSARSESVLRYGVALAITAAAALLQRSLWSTLPPSPQLFFYPAVFVVAWLVGLRPALVSIAVSVPIMAHWFLPPYGLFAIENQDDLLDLLLYSVMAVTLAVLMDRVRRSEAKARIAIEAAPFPTAILGSDGRVLYANPALQEALGYSNLALEGRHVRQLVHRDDAASFGVAVSTVAGDARREGGQRRFSCRAHHRDGRVVLIEGTLRRFHRRGAAGVLIQFQDVTRRRSLEADRERALTQLRQVVEQCPVGMVILRDGGREVHSNLAGLSIYGDRTTQAGELALLDRESRPLTPDERPSVRALRGERLSGLEVQLRRADGIVIPLLVNTAPIDHAEGEGPAAVVVFQDISPLKELERLRMQWNAVVAHDLRQPINSIKLRTDYLARRAAAPQEDLEALARATRRLNHMVQDLLDASSLEVQKLPLSRAHVDLATVVRDRIECARQETRERSFDLEVLSPENRVWADSDRLAQILDNLISNAVKYGEPGTPILVRVGADEANAFVAVTNEGGEIPEAEISHLFDRFRRGVTVFGREIKGTGLGLYIVKELVSAHGGEITCTSVRGVTTFRFSIPRRPAPTRHVAPN